MNRLRKYIILFSVLLGLSVSTQAQTVGTNNFPTGLNTTGTLFITKNRATTTISGSITSGSPGAGDSLTVVSTSGFPASGSIVVGGTSGEIMYYSSTTSTTFVVSARGQDGTVASSFPSGASVNQYIIAAHHNVLADAIVADETKLGYTPGGVQNTPILNYGLRGGTLSGTSLWSDKAVWRDVAGSFTTIQTFTTHIRIVNPGEMRLVDTGGTNFIGLKSPSSVSSSVTFTTPGADGTSGQCLKTNGSGLLSFGDCSVGTGTVTSIATGNGLQGGSITSNGTIDLRLNASGGLSKTLGGGSNELGISAGGVSNAMLATISTVGKVSDSALSSNVPLKNAANLFTTVQTIRRSNIAVTQTDGLILENTQAATVGTPVQISPSIYASARVWDSDAGANIIAEARQTLVPLYNVDKTRVEGRLTWSLKTPDTGSFVDVGYIDSLGIFQTSGAMIVGDPLPQGGAGFIANGSNSSTSMQAGGFFLYNSPNNDSVTISLANETVGDANSAAIFQYYGEYIKFQKVGAISPPPTILQLAGDSTDENVIEFYGPRLTSGALLYGKVPASGFTGSLIKIANNAGSPVTKFEVSATGAITTGTIPYSSITAKSIVDTDVASNAAIAVSKLAASTITLVDGTGISGGAAVTLGGSATLSVVADSVVEKVRVSGAGSLISTRREINFIGDSNISITPTDDSGNNRANVTLAIGSTVSTSNFTASSTITSANYITASDNTRIDANGLKIGTSGSVYFTTAASGGTIDTRVYHSAANTLTISDNSTGNGNLSLGHLTTLTRGEVRFSDSDSSNYVGFKGASTIGSNLIWTLPNGDGTSGQALVTDGSGVLSFASLGAASISGFPDGSILFATSGAFANDDANFHVDVTNTRLGIGTNSPGFSLHIADAGTPTILLHSTDSNPLLRLRYGSGGTQAKIQFENNSATEQGSLLVDSSANMIANATVISLRTGGTERIYIASGGIGLGTNASITERLVLPNANFIGFMNAGASQALKFVGLDASDIFQVASGGQQVSINGKSLIAPSVATTGSPFSFKIAGAAHTTLTASTEASDVDFTLNRTVQFATGALTTQRAVVFRPPTYAFVGASTITAAATVAITGPPVAGTNATITNAYAFQVESGNALFAGNLAASSVAIGTTTSHASAIVTMVSTTQGLLPPRHTTTQRDAVSSPAEGLWVHDTTIHQPSYYDGSAWQYVINANTVIGISKGGTGQITKAAAFDALSPMTTSGDIIYGGASGTGTRLAKGTDGQVLALASGLPSWTTPATAVAKSTLSILGSDIQFAEANGIYTTAPGDTMFVAASSTAPDDDTIAFIIPYSGTLKNLYVRTGNNGRVGTVVFTVTVRKNGVDTTLTTAVPTATRSTTSDTTHSVSVTAGDRITIQAVPSAGGGFDASAGIASISVEFDG